MMAPVASPAATREGALGTLEEHARARDVVLAHGWNTTSFQTLGRGMERHIDAVTGALVGYVDTGSAWVAAGAPIAPEGHLVAAARGFVAEAARRRRIACFFAVEERFLLATGSRSVPIGEQPVWDPSAWPVTLSRTPSLREQLRRARAKGVRAEEVDGSRALAPGAPLRREADRLVAAWLRARSMMPMRFLVDVAPFDLAADRLVVAAHRDARLVGLLVASPIPARRGWLLEHVLRDPHEAPNGTAETLVDAALRAAAARGASRVTMGLAPLAGEVHPVLRLARRAGHPLYDFEGLRAFKAKLRPSAWETVHLAVPDGVTTWSALVESLRAFAGGSLARFGVGTLIRRAGASRRAVA
jgi:lysylphosphatidylglycerol synthetase-like protein (DUF2156 family)